MNKEIYLLLKTALTSEEFEMVEKYINNLQGRIDDCHHYLSIMLPENEDAFYCTQILEGKFDHVECGRINYLKDRDIYDNWSSDHIPRID